MKKIILMMTVLLGFAFNAQAAPMAETQLPAAYSSFEEELVKLFNQEAQIPNSPINKYMTALKADPENDNYWIDDTITTADILRLDSGASGGTFGIDYLIVIRAGYKSNTFAVGYLKGLATGAIDIDDTTTLKITEPAKVTIE
ncbi:hypothetical protein D3C87_1439940 [compost metagenome]